jgi:hypothetical protein
MPVITAGLAFFAVHALLHHRPFSRVGDEEAVKIKVEAVLHGGAVDLGHQPARPSERRAVEPDAVAERFELLRRAAGMLAAPAADMNAEFACDGVLALALAELHERNLMLHHEAFELGHEGPDDRAHQRRRR